MVILVALTLGGVLAGIVGVLLAVPVAAAGSVIADHMRGGGSIISPKSVDDLDHTKDVG